MSNHIKSKTPLFIVKTYDTLHLFLSFFFKRKKKTTFHDFKEPFFIIGSGRSGNTLIRSMLVAGEEVSIPPESYVWPRIIRIFATYNFLPWEKICSLIIAEFEAYKEFYTWEMNLYKAHKNTRELPKDKQTLSYIIREIYKTYQGEKGEENRLWGDKTPINTLFVDKVVKIFPNAKFIHIIREPKDVACSYVKAGLYEKHEEAANFWKLAITKVLAFRESLPDKQFHQVAYEDLVRSPKRELSSLCDFLEISYTDKMLDFWKNAENLGDVKFRKHHANLGSALTTQSIGKWENELSSEDVQIIDEITLSLYEKIR